MRLRVIEDINELSLLARSWNDLLRQSASHVPFLRAEYIKAWWQHLGGGEWQQGDLYIVVAEEDNLSDQLLGIAPLFITKNKLGAKQLMFIGSAEISDYLDVIVKPENTLRFLDALFENLDQLPRTTWREMHWVNVLEDSPTVTAFNPCAEAKGWKVDIDRLQPAPYIPLKDSWDSYLATVDKKQRHEIRRKLRRFEELPNKKQWYIVQEAEKLDEELEAFFNLMLMDKNKVVFLSDRMRLQMISIAHAAFEAGWLQLAFLEIDGEKAAAYLNFDYANQLWIYNSGLNPKFAHFSPGWVLLGYLIQWAIDHGRQIFDFMRGEEDYKIRFGSINRYVMRLSAYR